MPFFAFLFAGNSFASAFSDIGESFGTPNLVINLLDIFLLSVLFFTAWLMIRKTRVGQYFLLLTLAWGICSFIAYAVNLRAVSFVLVMTMKAGLFGAVFIAETHAVDHIGKAGNFSFSDWFRQVFLKKKESNAQNPVDAISQVAIDLSHRKTGALIVIERKDRLDELIRTGVNIDAIVSPYLIRNIFYEGAPLHDGAMIIRNGRISAVGCILPITHRLDVDQDLGTRHRAAIGTSENTDAVVIVISEETGSISLACNSVLSRDIPSRSFKEALSNLLNTSDDESDD